MSAIPATAPLSQRVNMLEEENRQLKELLQPKLERRFPSEWGLTPSEARLLDCLYSSPKGRRTHEQIRFWMYGRRMREEKILHVYVCKIRKKLAPFNIEIQNSWGTGYELPAASLAVVRSAAE